MSQMLQLHRAVNFVVGSVIVILLGVILYLTLQSPLVVVTTGDEQRFYETERRPTAITEKDVERFVREFLEDLLAWEKPSPDEILQRIAPVTTSGLAGRIKEQLFSMVEKSFKGKVLAEDIANVHVKVTEKDVIASFDKVLRIDGIPLVIPTEISFNIIRGAATRWNPIGLYVNGLVEHEGPKN